MRGLQLTGPGDLHFVDLPDRDLGPREVRLRTMVSAVSHGTELNTYRGTVPLDSQRFDPGLRVFIADPEATSYPATLGYESIGRVVETGADVSEFEVGDTVHTGTPHQDTVVTGPDEYRGFYPMVRLPDHPTHDPGLFVSLGAVALQAVHDARPKIGDVVVVSGAGVIGLLTVQLVVASGARVLVIEPDARRRDQAMQAGAVAVVDPAAGDDHVGHAVKTALGGVGADIAIETSGHYAGLHNCIASVRFAATVVAVGFYQGGGTALRLGEEWHHNRITLLSSMGVWDNPHRDHPSWDRPRMMRTVVELLYGGRLRTDFLPVDRRRFEDAPDVYRDLAAHPTDHVKIAFEY